MESWYGGRTGAAFVIKERFDGIDIPEGTYSSYAYAIDIETGKFVITTKENGGNVKIDENNYLIRRLGKNWRHLGYRWKLHDNDGSQIDDTNFNFPELYARGMVQCFKQGAMSSSLVNYGEYVIIDTIADRGEYNNPDNGKVFRRGMNIEDELGGAEYIGQIVGPQGETPELRIDSYDTIDAEVDDLDADEHKDSYTVEDKDLIPGKLLNEETGEYEYPVDIKYIYTTLRDPWDNVTGCAIGFKIPYLVIDTRAVKVSPYDENGVIKEIDEELISYGENETPFYKNWTFGIPHGIKGDSFNGFDVITNAVKENQSLQVYDEEGNELEIIDTTIIDVILDNNDLSASEKDKRRKISYTNNDGEEVVGYINQEDTWKKVIRSHSLNFDTYEVGEESVEFLSDLKWVNRVEIKDNKVYFFDSQEEKVEEGYLNYVREFICSDPTKFDLDNKYPEVPYYHLLVRYTDPEKTELLSNGITYTYYSQLEDNHEADDWIDLGDIRGAVGGVRTLGSFTLEELKDIPPEDLNGIQRDMTKAGWCVTVPNKHGDEDYYAYDYLKRQWYQVFSFLNGSIANGFEVVAIAEEDPFTEKPIPEENFKYDRMSAGALWMVKEPIIVADF